MNTNPAPRITDVTITANADDGTFTVRGTWVADGHTINRPQSTGYRLNSKPLARRMAAAMTAGLVFLDPEIQTGTTGDTYVTARATVLGRYANADLRKLGY